MGLKSRINLKMKVWQFLVIMFFVFSLTLTFLTMRYRGGEFTTEYELKINITGLAVMITLIYFALKN